MSVAATVNTLSAPTPPQLVAPCIGLGAAVAPYGNVPNVTVSRKSSTSHGPLANSTSYFNIKHRITISPVYGVVKLPFEIEFT